MSPTALLDSFKIPDTERLRALAQRPVADPLDLLPDHVALSSHDRQWPGLLVWHQRGGAGELYVPPTPRHVLVIKLDRPNLSLQSRVRPDESSVEGTWCERRYWPRGGTAIVPAGEASYWSNEDGRDNLHVQIEPALLLRSATALSPRGASQLRLMRHSVVEDERLRLIGMTLLEALHRPGPSDLFFVEGLAQALASHLVASHSVLAPQQEGTPALGTLALRQLDDYIGAHLGDAIRLADLAAVVGLSEAHFTRRFKRATGVSPYQHVLACRMRHAMALLSGTRRSVLDIALEVGFQDAAHFSRSFRQHAGLSPQGWRGR